VLGLRAASAVPSGAFTGECRAVHCFAVTDRSSPSLRWRYVCGLCGLNVCSACAGEVRMLPERGDDFGGGFEDGEGGYVRFCRLSQPWFAFLDNRWIVAPSSEGLRSVLYLRAAWDDVQGEQKYRPHSRSLRPLGEKGLAFAPPCTPI